MESLISFLKVKKKSCVKERKNWQSSWGLKTKSRGNKFTFWLDINFCLLSLCVETALLLLPEHKNNPQFLAQHGNWWVFDDEVNVFLGRSSNTTVPIWSLCSVMHDLYLQWHSALPLLSPTFDVFLYHMLCLCLHKFCQKHGFTVTSGNGGHLLACFRE